MLAGVDLTVANGVDANGNPVHIIQDDEWNGERLFQAAKFGTETQYQHLVFEEFARKVSPNIHLFGNNDIHLDPAITSEFAQRRLSLRPLDAGRERQPLRRSVPTARRSSMPATGQPVLNAIGLIDAFLNPLEFAAHGATATGEIVLGSVNQVANEIDEFVTGALRTTCSACRSTWPPSTSRAAATPAWRRSTWCATRSYSSDRRTDTTMKPYASWDEFGSSSSTPARWSTSSRPTARMPASPARRRLPTSGRPR